MAGHPDRFMGVALLPTTNPEVMLPEFEWAVNDLGMVGGFFVVGPTVKPNVCKMAGIILSLYTEGGTITLIPYNGERKGIKIIAQDNKRPGIEDVQRVLAGGYTTSKGLGMGISGSNKIMDEFEIQTVLGGGTTIKASKWLV